jgi:uncharacterized protein
MTIETTKKTNYDILRERREEVIAIAAKYQAHNIRLVKEWWDAGPDIDGGVDILVDFEENFKPLNYGGISEHTREVLGFMVFPHTEDSMRDNGFAHLLNNIIPL